MGLFLVVWLQVKIQNSKIDCTAKWFSTHRHIDCNRVPFSIGFDSITSERISEDFFSEIAQEIFKISSSMYLNEVLLQSKSKFLLYLGM